MSEIITLKNNDIIVEISTKGAEIQKIQSKSGTDFLWNGDANVWSGRAPILFPICGGLKDGKYILNGKEYSMPKHGFARKKEFTLEKSDGTSAVFLLKESEETLQQFPYAFELRACFTLNKNSLEVSYNVTNKSDDVMYFSTGAHEAYACPEGIEEYNIIFDKTENLKAQVLAGDILALESNTLLENSNVLPLKYEYFAIDALVINGLKSRKVTLAHKNSSKKVTVEFNNHNYFLLWTKPNANYICIEPWCGIHDTVASDYDITKKEGIHTLNKNEQYTATHTITVEE